MKKTIPLILIELYLAATYLIYRFGVWMFPYKADNRCAVFVLTCMAAFCAGYLVVLKKCKSKEYRNKAILKKIVYALCIAGALLMIPYCYSKTLHFYPPLFTSIQDLSIAYTNATTATQTMSVLHYVAGIGRPFVYYLFFVTYFYWDSIGKRIRWVALLETIWFVLVDMSTGHNVGIFSYCIMLIIMYIAWLSRDSKTDKKKLLKRTAITLLAILIMPLYFGSALSSRGASTLNEMDEARENENADIIAIDMFLNNPEFVKKMEDVYGYKRPVVTYEGEGLDFIAAGEIPAKIIEEFDAHKEIAAKEHPYYADAFTNAYVDVEGKLYNSIPNRLRFLFVEGSYYVSHGYYGVSIGLRQPFSCSYGLGTFAILQGPAKKLTGIDFYKKTYIYKANQAGYPISFKWGTAFTQFASDVSYPGVPIILFVLGALLAVLWYEVIFGNKMLSLMVLVPLGYYMVMIVSWWHPGMSGSDFVLLNLPLAIWIVLKIGYSIRLKRDSVQQTDD